MKLVTEVKNVLIDHALTLTHKELPGFFQSLGMPMPNNINGTKREKAENSLDQVSSEKIPTIAEGFIEYHCKNPITRNTLQDLLWNTLDEPQISKRYRREIANVIDDNFYLDAQGFDQLLEQLWILEDPNDKFGIFADYSKSLKKEIHQHIHRNPGDWNAHKLFQELGAYNAPNKRFRLLIEGLASGEVRPDESEQRKFVQSINPILRNCGLKFTEDGGSDGYSSFKIIPINKAQHEKPKNLIFASSEKPDLRLQDAISNRVEVLTHQDKVLVYDQDIPDSGLTWSQLQKWWKDTKSISDDDEAKKTLYKRLKSCFPQNSPPQKHFFDAFHSYYGATIPSLPALLPEVWLFWDPKTIRERGIHALKNLRMDFLLLLSGSARVIIEIDGKQHYSCNDGIASPEKYARLVSADRDMKLLGYDIYRFGGSELNKYAQAKEIVGPFFDQLFKKYSIRSDK